MWQEVTAAGADLVEGVVAAGSRGAPRGGQAADAARAHGFTGRPSVDSRPQAQEFTFMSVPILELADSLPYRGGGLDTQIGLFAFPGGYLLGPYLEPPRRGSGRGQCLPAASRRPGERSAGLAGPQETRPAVLRRRRRVA